MIFLVSNMQLAFVCVFMCMHAWGNLKTYSEKAQINLCLLNSGGKAAMESHWGAGSELIVRWLQDG